MYERFTDRARKIMQLANLEAQRFNHEYIGTEHLLLGCIKEGAGVAANILKNLDVDLRKIRLEVDKLVQSGPDMVTMGKLPQTPRYKKVIKFAMEEARNLNHNFVGTEHILLGLLHEQEDVAAQVLMNIGLKLEDVRVEVLNFLGHGLEGADDKDVIKDQFASHPMVQEIQSRLESLKHTRDVAISDQDFEQAAAIRVEGEKLQSQLSKLIRILESDPTFGLPLTDELARYCQPVPDLSIETIHHDALQLCMEQLRNRGNVLLVGKRGSGRSTLAGCLEGFGTCSEANDRLLPFSLVQPNLFSMMELGGHFGDRLCELVEKLSASPRYVLTLPDFHHNCDENQVGAAVVEGWRQTVPVALERGLPLLAWTTPEGVDVLRAVWPDLVKRATLIRLPPMSAENVQRLIQKRLDEAASKPGIDLEEGLLDVIMQYRHVWKEGVDLVEPGRSVRLVDYIVKSENERQASEARRPVAGAESKQVQKLRNEAIKLMQSMRVEEAMAVMGELRTRLKQKTNQAETSIVNYVITKKRVKQLIESVS